MGGIVLVVFTPSAPQESPPSSAETYDDIGHPPIQFRTITSSAGTVLLKENSHGKKPLRIQRRIYYLLVAAFVIFSVLSCVYIFYSKFTLKQPISSDQSSAMIKPSKTVHFDVSFTLSVFSRSCLHSERRRTAWRSYSRSERIVRRCQRSPIVIHGSMHWCSTESLEWSTQHHSVPLLQQESR